LSAQRFGPDDRGIADAVADPAGVQFDDIAWLLAVLARAAARARPVPP